MKGINLTRVLLGGLAAGVLITLGEFVLWGLVLETQYQAMMARHSLAEASWAMAWYVIGTLIMGLAIAFLYAAFRPRLGAGWQTGAVAGAMVWLVGLALPQIGNAAIGLNTGAMGLILAYCLVELSLGGVVAGWVYREQEAPAAARMPAM